MKKLHVFSSISFRLLVFNVLIVFFPIASFLFLSTYEQQLLQYLEHALVQQGRILAAALGDHVELTEDRAVGLLMRLERQHDARLRVLDSTGHVLADSSVIPPREDADETALTLPGRPGDTGWGRGYTEQENERVPGKRRDADCIIGKVWCCNENFDWGANIRYTVQCATHLSRRRCKRCGSGLSIQL